MLACERVVWLSTVRPDGSPHLVPTWFLWDGEALLVWSKPNAVKVRNLRANPRLMVALGDAAADLNVGLIEAEAELVDPLRVPGAFLAKYAAELAKAGLDPAAFRATYPQAIRIIPTSFLAWHGRGDRAASSTMTTPTQGPTARVAAGLAAWLERASCWLRDLGGPSPAGIPSPVAA
jgi:PPOX class probable F420-dependent enzyme